MIDPRHAWSALLAIDPGCGREEWHAIGRAAIAAGLTVDDLVEWSRGGANFTNERDVRAAFRSIQPTGGTGPGTLWRAAKDAGWVTPREGEAAPARIVRPPLASAAAAVQRDTLSDYGRRLFDSGQAPAGGALAYLTARGCVVPPQHGHLRFVPALRHPATGYEGLALVALVTDAVSATPLTLHRTWIRADGAEAPEADPPRMLLGGHRKAGGVVRLWPDEAVSGGLAIAEGIETALSLAHAFTPVWACLDAGNLAAFPVLDGIEALTIGADHDPAGLQAAEACAERWARAGRDVRIVRPPCIGQDINDLAREVA